MFLCLLERHGLLQVVGLCFPSFVLQESTCTGSESQLAGAIRFLYIFGSLIKFPQHGMQASYQKVKSTKHPPQPSPLSVCLTNREPIPPCVWLSPQTPQFLPDLPANWAQGDKMWIRTASSNIETAAVHGHGSSSQTTN